MSVEVLHSENGWKDATREFYSRVGEERRLAARGRRALTLVSFDRINPAPDRDEAEILELKRPLRATDTFCWTGKTRLELLLPDTTARTAERVLEALIPRAGERRDMAYSVIELVQAQPHPTSATATDADAPQWALADDSRIAPGLTLDMHGIVSLFERPLPAWKRGMDIVLAGLGLIAAAPLMALIAVAIKATSRGPVIFGQLRTGARLRRFKLYKFRTMYVGAHAAQASLAHLNEMKGPLFKSDRDPRVTPLGRLLRKFSLDELPQLVNVLEGSMTLIGPRALSPEPDAYEPWQLRRFLVRPGLACYWQASRRAEVDFDEWMRSDLTYVDQGYSLIEDCRLLVRIAVAVVKGSGAR